MIPVRYLGKEFLKMVLKSHFFKRAFLRLLVGLGVSGSSSRLDVLKIDIVPDYTYKIVSVYPHDEAAFTQGLVFENGILYEGTGLRGRSSLRKVDLETGQILQIHQLPAHLFGEGITVYNNKIIQLTWRSNKGFVYDKNSFELLAEFNCPTEGWGITYDGEYLIVSEGTATLYFLDPENFKKVRHVEVYDKQGGPVIRLNDLEYVEGEIYANVWKKEYIARISPQTGEVVGWIELKGLLPDGLIDNQEAVLNGIAYDREDSRLFVTGKLWPQLFEIKLVAITASSKK